MEATITDKDGNTWRIKIIPGVHRIDRGAVRGWKKAGRLIDDLWDGQFYSRTVYRKGLRPGTRLARASLVDFWFEGIQRDFAVRQNESSQFQRGDFGRTFFKVWSDVKFGLKVTGRTVAAPLGASLGIAYAGAAPVTIIASRPVGAGIYAAFPGAAVPAVLYVWNGTGWTATYFSSVPGRQNVWVHLQTGAKEFTIDIEGFKAILEGTAAANLTEAQVKTIRDETQELTRKMSQNGAEIRNLQANLRQGASFKMMQDEIARARAAQKTRLDDESSAIRMNGDDLRKLIREHLKDLGVNAPTDAQVESIANEMRNTIDSLLR
jgi:hypothetical protein